MKIIIHLFYSLIFFFLLFCSSSQIVNISPISSENYTKLTWEQKLNLFNNLDLKKKKYPGKDIYLAAFRDPVPSVTIASLKNLPDIYAEEFKTTFYGMVKVKNPVIRWQVCEKISIRPDKSDLPYLALMFQDRDWMVRECAFKNIRLYNIEKDTKTYFFTIISYLYDKNSQVLSQIYKTLKWYNDTRAYPFLYKRSYVADTNSELIVILQELSEIQSDKIKNRIWYVSKNHRDYFVRKEAERLFNSMR